MTIGLLRFGGLGFSLILTMGCGEAFEGASGGRRFMLPWPVEGGGYRLTPILIETLPNTQRASGPAAHIVMSGSPSADPRGFEAAPISAGRAGGVWWPKDVNSGVALSAYALLERIRAWERQEALPAVENGPIPLVINARVLVRVGSQIGRGFNNAFFEELYNALWVMPYAGQNIPLAINLGVIAHEYAHARFSRDSVTPPFLSMSDPRAAATLWLGWNEGLADYFGFVFSGQPRFGEESLGEVDLRIRALDGPLTALWTSKQFAHCLQRRRLEGLHFTGDEDPSFPVDRDLAYILGAQYARRLYRMGQIMGGDLSTHRRILAEVFRGLPRDLEVLRGRDYQPAMLWALIEERLKKAFPNMGLVTSELANQECVAL